MCFIDLIVDIFNYVMFEFGQFIVLYDCCDVVGDGLVVVFGLCEGEIVKDLLGNMYQVGLEDLLILDVGMSDELVMMVVEVFVSVGQFKEGLYVLGIVGIMGGDYGYVCVDICDVVIELVYFDFVLLCWIFIWLGFKIDVVYCYECGVDLLLVFKVVVWVVELLCVVGGIFEVGQMVVGIFEVLQIIIMIGEQICVLLGMYIGMVEMCESFICLGCIVMGDGDSLIVILFLWWVDMVIWQDFVEEVV